MIIFAHFQVTIPVGKHKESPISISFIAFHSVDKFLLDTVLDMYSSIQEKVSIASHSSPLPDTNDNLDVSELLKEKVSSTLRSYLSFQCLVFCNIVCHLYPDSFPLHSPHNWYLPRLYANKLGLNFCPLLLVVPFIFHNITFAIDIK